MLIVIVESVVETIVVIKAVLEMRTKFLPGTILSLWFNINFVTVP